MDVYWVISMQDELHQFEQRIVWYLVPKPAAITIIGIKWVFRNKLDESRAMTRNKYRLVVQGYNKGEGMHYDKTFSPVARITAIRILIESATLKGFKLFEMDVESPFLNGYLKEEVYVKQPP
ncbi:uncharacterized mitochondrial protein AtMg00820-like [Solanum lycopersicum]|uniref:uncharacterized mitochondrial protein AtMg00820-like n=1 Tax=Solanum lycopersicum TaxID=4081 RepID=UPI0037483D8F